MLAIGMRLALLAGLAAASACEDEEVGCSNANFLQVSLDTQALRREAQPATKPLWPHMRGQIPGQYGTTADTFGRLGKPTFSFHHPEGQYHSLLSGGPVIDEERNLYQMSSQGVVKLSETGEVLWLYKPPGHSNNAPTLMGEALLGTTTTGFAWAVDRKTGQELWKTKLAADAGGDCGYPAGFEGLLFVGAQEGHDYRQKGGNAKVFAINATTGGQVWEYTTDSPVWNFSPLFPGDGSLVFMDFAGGMYRLGLTNGTVLWFNLPPKSNDTFSDGGPALGPNQMVYSCSNYNGSLGQGGQLGAVRAFELKDGRMVWEHITSEPCNSYPAVGNVNGISELAVVVTTGGFVGAPHLGASIGALDAATGEVLWKFDLEPYTGPLFMAAGDTEGVLTRIMDHLAIVCLPAHWSAAYIDGNGVIYAGRLDGNLYVVYGPQSEKTQLAPGMKVDSATGLVIDKFDLGSAPLHGAMAFAPGLLAYATCDTLHVFHP